MQQGTKMKSNKISKVQLEEMLQDPSFVSFISGFTPNKKALTKSTASAGAPVPTTVGTQTSPSHTAAAGDAAATAVGTPQQPTLATAAAAAAGAAATQKPPLPTLSKDMTQVKANDIIPLDEKAFCYHRDGIIQGTSELSRGSASKKAKNRAVLAATAHLINNPKLSDKQKVYALRKAFTHHLSRRIFHSAGLIDNKRYETMKYFFNQIKKLVQEATATDDRRGRAADDKQALVNAVLLATASTPSTENNQDDSPHVTRSDSAPPSQRVLFDLIGIHQATGQKK